MCRINGKKLGELRSNAGVSQKELGKMIGVSSQTISHYELGETNPSDEVVEKICMILKINKGDIKILDVGYDYKSGVSKVVDHERKVLGKNRKCSPEVTEAFINKNRIYSEKEEANELKHALAVGSTVAGKKYIIIDPTCLHVPHWQRDTDFAKAAEIAVNYDVNKIDPIKIYIVNQKGYVADGLHRVVAITKRNEGKAKEDREYIITEVLNCTEYEAVNVFFDQEAGRTHLTINDAYRAGITAEKPDYLKLKEICENNDIQITAEEKIINNPIGKLTPSRSALRLANASNNPMQEAITLLKDLHWTGSSKNAFTMRNFNVIKRLFANNKNNTEYVKEKLLKTCKGAAFYESIVAPVKSDAELYDILADKIK